MSIATGFTDVIKAIWGSTLGKVAVLGGGAVAATTVGDAVVRKGNSALNDMVQGPQEALALAAAETGVNTSFYTFAKFFDMVATWIDSFNPNGPSDFTRGVHAWAQGRMRQDPIPDKGDTTIVSPTVGTDDPNGGKNIISTSRPPNTPDKPFNGIHATSVGLNGLYTGAIDGTASVLGAPVDLINAGLKKLFNIKSDSTPFGGSESIKGGLSAVYNGFAEMTHLNVTPENHAEELIGNTAFTTTKIGSELAGAFTGATIINGMAKTAVSAGKIMDLEIGRDIFAPIR